MTTAEKAHAYDEALEKARQLCEYPTTQPFVSTLEEIFPEIQGSEDERIRKGLVRLLKELLELGGVAQDEWDRNECEKYIAWIEKQKPDEPIKDDDVLDGNEDGLIAETIRYKNEKQREQKASYTTLVETGDGGINALVTKELHTDVEQNSTNKVEPKFKVGDWVVENDFKHKVQQIKEINDDKVWFTDGTGTFVEFLKTYHLWTIQDAKDGDVLYVNNTLSESIMIYKSFDNGIINKYASYNKFGFEDENYLTLNDGYIIPATKEQCTELFQKMNEAGYEWDAEKKELKKIEQKPEWSEEDEEMTNVLPLYLNQMYSSYMIGEKEVAKTKEWLKQLKDRILPQPKQEWTEEDEDKYMASLRILRATDGHPTILTKWLNSIKERLI